MLCGKIDHPGAVIQDARAEAEAIYSIEMNLVYGKAPLDGTNQPKIL